MSKMSFFEQKLNTLGLFYQSVLPIIRFPMHMGNSKNYYPAFFKTIDNPVRKTAALAPASI